jgi:hypothetical protein
LAAMALAVLLLPVTTCEVASPPARAWEVTTLLFPPGGDRGEHASTGCAGGPAGGALGLSADGVVINVDYANGGRSGPGGATGRADSADVDVIVVTERVARG